MTHITLFSIVTGLDGARNMSCEVLEFNLIVNELFIWDHLKKLAHDMLNMCECVVLSVIVRLINRSL